MFVFVSLYNISSGDVNGVPSKCVLGSVQPSKDNIEGFSLKDSKTSKLRSTLYDTKHMQPVSRLNMGVCLRYSWVWLKGVL